MKALKRVLILDRDGRSVGPLMGALLQQTINADPVLSLGSATVECAGIGLGAGNVVEGKQVKQQVVDALTALGIAAALGESMDIKKHEHMLRRADVIVAATLAEEDAVCLALDDAWSKTVTVQDSMTLIGVHSPIVPDHATVKDYVEWAAFAKPVASALGRMLKQSYSSAVLARGICRKEGIATGKAHVARHSKDLIGFRRGEILVIDRAGTLMFQDMSDEVAQAVIETIDPGVKATNGLEVLKLVVKRADAVVCSRDDKYVTFPEQDTPRLAYCVGATDRISPGQAIVVDAEGGSVYSTALLEGLT